MAMAADWSQLLPELVMEIAKNLTVVTDQISFTNVCNSWQSSVSTLENFFVSPPRFPYLLLAENKKRKSVSIISKLFNDWKDWKDEEGEEQPNNNNNNILREVFFLTPNGEEEEDGKSKIYKILLPEAANKRCLSSHGWLLTVSVSEENFESVDAALLHPLTRRQIQLPKLDTFPRYEYHHVGYGHMISKMVLSSDPLLTDDLFVMVIWGCPERVGYCRPGFPSWIKLPREEYRLPVDINYHNGRMYIVDWWGDICSCDMTDDKTRILHGQPKPDLDGDMCSCSGIFQTHPKLPDEIEGIEIERATNRLFYVLGGFDDDDDDDKLVVVVRAGRKDIREDYNYKKNKTSGFQVFEINLKDDRWVKVESLGDRALFLGYNTSISLQADGSIVKPNCIYFTEDFYERYAGDESEGGGTDMGIYHLSDGTIEPHFKGESLDVVSPPLWVVPSF